MNYYNEFDPKSAAWLRELIGRGLIPNGIVDERSIAEVTPGDLRGYCQCHFFAGIGGWSLALQLAGWPSDRPVWTGSCPCQPFSTAGKGLAQKDERHLWPVFFDLIRQCRPEHVFGEQVASAISHGWLDGVSADLEAEGYACGATVLGAHSVNSPHQRQRLYWVADAGYGQRGRPGEQQSGCQMPTERSQATTNSQRCGTSDGLDDARRPSHERRGDAGDVGCPSGEEQGEARERQWSGDADSDSVQDDYRLGNSENIGREGGHLRGDRKSPDGVAKASAWSDFQFVHCRDGKTRRVPTESAFFPLAHGVPARVVRLRGYGNAIVPQVASVFIQEFLRL